MTRATHRCRVAVAVGLAVATTASPANAESAQAAAASGCAGTAYVYGVNGEGRLTLALIDAATVQPTKRLTGVVLPFSVRALAALNYNTLVVESTAGGLYRIDVTRLSDKLVTDAPRALAPSGWTFDKLTADGFGHLFATSSTGVLWRWDVTSSKPTGSGITAKTRIGTDINLRSLAGTGGSQLIGTTVSGKLLGYKAIGLNRFNARTLDLDGWDNVDKVTSPGGGLFFARNITTGSVGAYKDADVSDLSGSDISRVGSVATSGWTHKQISAAPKTVTCGSTPAGGITYDALVTMFGQGWVGDRTIVERGLPSLQAEMTRGQITNAARKAAFLATLVSESAMRYDADEGGSYTYHGRGYIQLTNDFNYDSAGTYFDVDLLGQPELARSLQYSAPIARWYWTVERTTTNAYADAHDMHGVNRNIGFAWNYDEATRRCDRFKSAYKYFTGSYPTNVTCYPDEMPPEGSTDWYVQGSK